MQHAGAHLFVRSAPFFAEAVFKAIGAADAALAAKALLAADLRGIDSHGTARLSGYLRLIDAGRIKPAATAEVIHQTLSTATVDGHQGLGLTIAPAAMQVAIEKASAVGSGWVSVKNSNHFGIAAFHAMLALPHNMTGYRHDKCEPADGAYVFNRKAVGHQPICVAIPAGGQPPFVAGPRHNHCCQW